MNTPTLEQFNTVIENFNKILSMPEANTDVDMDEIEVYRDCGSPMCHGGWYAMAAIPDIVKEGEGFITYDTGAICMSCDLGFDNEQGLEKWARAHPHLWGCSEGDKMFSSPLAFLDDEDHERYYDLRDETGEDFSQLVELNLEDIRNWWVAVRDRCHPEEK